MSEYEHDDEEEDELEPETEVDLVNSSIANPQPPPMSPDSLLLAPKTSSASDFIIPGLIGVAGIALIYFAMKKDKKEDPKSKIVAEDDSVVFSKNFKNYIIGKDWQDEVFEPYLAHQAEEGSLVTDQNYGNLPIKDVPGSLKSSRGKVLLAFRSTTPVKTSSGEVLISKLPADNEGVKRFNSWLDSVAKKFQEDN